MRTPFVLLLLLALLAISCRLVTDPDAEILVLPAVLTTGNDYTADDLRQMVPDSALFGNFARAYGGRYSQTLKNELVEYIVSEAGRLKLNDRQLRSCLEASGQLQDSVTALPYRVESAKYESQRAWILEFTWGADSTLGHYRCFVLSAVRQYTLLYLASS